MVARRKYLTALLVVGMVTVVFSQMSTMASAYSVSEQARQSGQDFAWGKVTVDEQKYPTRYTYKVTFKWEAWNQYILWNGEKTGWSSFPILEIYLYIKNLDTGNYVFSKQVLWYTVSTHEWGRDPSCQYVDKNPYDVYYGSYVYGPTILPYSGNYEAWIAWRHDSSGDWNYYNLPGSYTGVQSGGWLPTFGTKGGISASSDWTSFPDVVFYARSIYN